MEKQKIDEVLQTIKRAVPNWQAIATVLGAIVLFGGLSIYFWIHYNSLKKDSWEKIAFAQGYAQNGMTQQAIQLLDEVIGKYPNSELAKHALLTKADISFKTKNYNLAASLYESIIKSDKKSIITPIAYAGLGSAKENMGDYDGAINVYKEFLDKYSDHYLAPRIYDCLARVYLLKNSPDLARQSYEKLATLYPGTYWSNQAQGTGQQQPQQAQQQAQPMQQQPKKQTAAPLPSAETTKPGENK